MTCDSHRVLADDKQQLIPFSMILGIVCASAYEAKPLIHRNTVSGKIYSVGPTSFLAVSGSGAANATQAAEVLLSKGAEALMSWGLAAGLKPGLLAGDVVLAEELLVDCVSFPVSRSWRKALRKRLADFTRVYDGPLLQNDSLLTRPTDKQLLYDSCAAIAADRESAAVAEIAKKARVPFMALKVIADSAQLRIPAVLATSLAENADLNFCHIFAGVGPRLWQWPATLRLTRSSWLGREKLQYIADKLDRDLGPPVAAARVSVAS
ncbi:MAG: hypothetical protein JXA04_08960 [Gammaproteobacteria bacterium]|nr:hypothetical protein [Gammaproteobacteria bacterium]